MWLCIWSGLCSRVRRGAGFAWCKAWVEDLGIWGERITAPRWLRIHLATCAAYQQGVEGKQSHSGKELHPDKWWAESNFQKWFKVSGKFPMLSRITRGMGSEAKQWCRLGDLGSVWATVAMPENTVWWWDFGNFPGPGFLWKSPGKVKGWVALSFRMMVTLLHGLSESWRFPGFSIHAFKRMEKT